MFEFRSSKNRRTALVIGAAAMVAAGGWATTANAAAMEYGGTPNVKDCPIGTSDPVLQKDIRVESTKMILGQLRVYAKKTSKGTTFCAAVNIRTNLPKGYSTSYASVSIMSASGEGEPFSSVVQNKKNSGAGIAVKKDIAHDNGVRVSARVKDQSGRIADVRKALVKGPSSGSSSGSGPSSGGTGAICSITDTDFCALAKCESSQNIRAVNSAGPYYGAFQFSVSTWRSVGGKGLPSEASAKEQLKRAAMLANKAGEGQWPVCGAGRGLRLKGAIKNP